MIALPCHIFPIAHPTHLHVNVLPNTIQQDLEILTLEKPISSHTSSSQTLHFGKKARSEEARKC